MTTTINLVQTVMKKNLASQYNPYIYAQIDSVDGSCAPIPARLAEQYSQCGEDLIVISLLEALRKNKVSSLPDTSIYIEIGANHPISGSNTYLLNRRGFQGILIEANPKLIAELRRHRPLDLIINAAINPSAQTFVDFYISNQHELSSLNKNFVASWHDGNVGISETLRVPGMRINDLLQQYVGNKTVAYMSIDIEGLDYSVLSDMDFEKWRPIIIQTEPSENFTKGNADRIINLLDKNNYLLIGVTDVNFLFMDKLFIGNIKPEISEASSLIAYLKKQLNHSNSILEEQKSELSRVRLALCEFSALGQEKSYVTQLINRILGKLLGVRLVRVRTLDRLLSSNVPY